MSSVPSRAYLQLSTATYLPDICRKFTFAADVSDAAVTDAPLETIIYFAQRTGFAIDRQRSSTILHGHTAEQRHKVPLNSPLLGRRAVFGYNFIARLQGNAYHRLNIMNVKMHQHQQVALYAWLRPEDKVEQRIDAFARLLGRQYSGDRSFGLIMRTAQRRRA